MEDVPLSEARAEARIVWRSRIADMIARNIVSPMLQIDTDFREPDQEEAIS